MSEIGYKYKIRDDELNKLILNVGLKNPIAILEKWFCQEGEEPAFFDYLHKVEEQVSDWDKGRIFDSNSEIRWEKTEDGFHVLWISHDGNINTDWEKEPIIFKEKRKVLLWGERIENDNDKKEWYEKQIPKIFEYPVDGDGKRAYIEIMEYAIFDDSKVYRFVEMISE